MLDFVRQFARFEAHEAIQNREVAIQERDLRNIYHDESHNNSRDVLVHLALRGYLCFMSSSVLSS